LKKRGKVVNASTTHKGDRRVPLWGTGRKKQDFGGLGPNRTCVFLKGGGWGGEGGWPPQAFEMAARGSKKTMKLDPWGKPGRRAKRKKTFAVVTRKGKWGEPQRKSEQGSDAATRGHHGGSE